VPPWIGPNETRSVWDKEPEQELPGRIRPTVERAHEVSVPFQYREQRSFDGTLADVEVDGVEYTSGEYVVDAGVTHERLLKLHVRGVLWKAGDSGSGRRFKLQIIREKPPTDTVPYDKYAVWQRYQFGDVTVDPVEGPQFDPDAEPTQTERTTTTFDALQKPVRLHISELELVRNPEFAEYRLAENDQWEEYGAVFRWRADAFQHRLE
jgi:hypothetical protein